MWQSKPAKGSIEKLLDISSVEAILTEGAKWKARDDHRQRARKHLEA